MGDPGSAEAVMFLGLHAASGTQGFLPHTMTSRLAAVHVNGAPIPEAPLFAALLTPYGIRPIFFSGCTQACRQAETAIPGIATHAIPKTKGPDEFDAREWRRGLAAQAVASLSNTAVPPLDGKGPFDVVVTFRDGEAVARRMARRWHLCHEGEAVRFRVESLAGLFLQLSTCIPRFCRFCRLDCRCSISRDASGWRGSDTS
jgi:D-aminopeptidase